MGPCSSARARSPRASQSPRQSPRQSLARARARAASPCWSLDLVSALDHIEIGVKSDFFYAARTLLVHDREDLELFDQAFDLFWRKPEYGGLSLNTQYSYIFRNPWDPAPSQLGDAHAMLLRSILWIRFTRPCRTAHPPVPAHCRRPPICQSS